MQTGMGIAKSKNNTNAPVERFLGSSFGWMGWFRSFCKSIMTKFSSRSYFPITAYWSLNTDYWF